jgi:hypothetical protein
MFVRGRNEDVLTLQRGGMDEATFDSKWGRVDNAIDKWLADPKTDLSTPQAVRWYTARGQQEANDLEKKLRDERIPEQEKLALAERFDQKWKPIAERIVAATSPAAPVAQQAAPAAAAPEPAAEVTPAYNAHAVRPPSGTRPAVTVAVAPTHIAVASTPSAAAPTVHYDAYGSVIAQPESVTLAQQAESARIQAILDSGAQGYSVNLPEPTVADSGVVTTGLLDTRLQLGADGPAGTGDSTSPPEMTVVAKRNSGPLSHA